MNDAKYIGLDVHQATISVAVRDSAGKLVMEAILETKAETILQFVRGLRGSLHVIFEEDACAAWLYALLKPHVTQVLVCDPRLNTSEPYAFHLEPGERWKGAIAVVGLIACLHKQMRVRGERGNMPGILRAFCLDGDDVHHFNIPLLQAYLLRSEEHTSEL